jgi:uncharacterized protein YcfJ
MKHAMHLRTLCTLRTLGTVFSLLGLYSVNAAAQEVARVISSTPIISQVQVPRQTCALERNGSFQNQVCTTQIVIESRATGFTVIYEYNGQLFSTQTAADPGPYLDLNHAQQLAGNYGQVNSQTYVQPYVQPYYSQRTYVAPAPIYIAPQVRPHFVNPPIVIRGGHNDGYRHDFGGYRPGHHGGQGIHQGGGHRGGHQGGNGRYEFRGNYR